MPTTANEAPTRKNCLIEKDEPYCSKSNTDMVEARRAKLRNESAAPNVAMSRTDNAKTDPRRNKPRSDREDPMRVNERIAIEAPKFKKSITATEEPILLKLLMAKAAPNGEMSMIDKENNEPKRVKPRRDTALPIRKTCLIDIEEPSRAKLSNETAAPSLEKLLKEIEDPP
jgi:hypothetical protein